jgi:VCBS repeat protein/HYR domain-containing protein
MRTKRLIVAATVPGSGGLHQRDGDDMNGRHVRLTMRLRSLLLVWAMVPAVAVAVAVAGAAPATAAPAPLWGHADFLIVQAVQAPSAVAVGDLDGNGFEDEVVVDAATNTLHVFLFVDTPVPGIAFSHVYATGNQPSSVKIGDLNADGIGDLVVANAGDGTISVRVGVDHGAGSVPRFDWPASIDYETGYTPASRPLSVAIGDLDGDGDPDLAVANFGETIPTVDGGSVSVLRNDGGSFVNRTDLVGEQSTSVAIGDLNGDGDLDLAVTSTNTSTNAGPHVSVWLQQGGVLVDTFDDQAVGASPGGLTVADLNDDGKLDLLTANENANTVSVLLNGNAPPANLWRRQDVDTGARPRSITVTDLNGDGVVDLATANGSGSISVLTGIGNGSFLPREDLPNNSDPSLVVPDEPAVIVAINWIFARDDDKPDLLVAGGGANPLSVFMNQSGPDTPPGSPVVSPVDRNSGGTPVEITFTDVDPAGVTSLISSDTGPLLPAGFELAGLYYHLETTAGFTSAEVCFSYTGPRPVVVVHWVGGVPVIEPTVRDTGLQVCVDVESFSPFALAVPVRSGDQVAPVIACGAPDGVWHGANVSIACTARDDGSGLADPANAAFLLSTAVLAGAEDANASTGSRQVCDVAGNCATAGPIDGNRIDRKAPTLTVPADRTVDATAPSGAAMTYTANARDGADANPTVLCTPASGAVFAIGTTAVSCSATDHVGNTSTATFHVAVKGAKDQLGRLIQKVVQASNLPLATKAILTQRLQALVATFDPTKAAQRQAVCAALKVFTTAAQLLSGHGIPTAQAVEWIADANRIRAVLGC